MKPRKICVVTGTRAEFGLLYWLLKSINEDTSLELQLVVTGMHLSPEFGLTYKVIEENDFYITRKIEMLMSSDTSIGISKSMGLGMISFSECFNELLPDIVVVLGDRYEIFSAVASAMVSRIPVAHIHGGEATEGSIDEPIRHSITKMSHLHFTANEEYRQRVIQLGEQPERVFNTGTPGLDNVFKLDLLNWEDFEESIDFKLGKRNALITFHPVTLENNTSSLQFSELLWALKKIDDLKIIFTKPNSDTDGRIIIQMIDEFVKSDPERYCSFQSLGQLRYLSALKHVDLVIGNSSSGLTEAPSFRIPTINIGDRQKGRLKADSVIDCQPMEKEILEAIQLGLSDTFKEKCQASKNPYGTEGASEKIKNILKSFDLEGIIKKEFYNL